MRHAVAEERPALRVPVSTPQPSTVAAVALGAATGVAVHLLEQRPVAIVGVAALSMTALRSVALRRPDAEWFHPAGFPLLYCALVLLAPALFIRTTGAHLGLVDKTMVSSQVITILLSCLAGIGVGTAGGLLLGRAKRDRSRHHLIDHRKLHRLGVGFLCLVAVAEALLFRMTRGQVYGAEQLTYGLKSIISSFVFVGLMSGTVVTVLANVGLGHGVLRRGDALVVAVAMGMALATGARAPVIGPSLFVLWAYHTHVRRLTAARVLVAGIVLLFAIQFVGAVRGPGAGSALPNSTAVLIDRTLGQLASPIYVTHQVVALVPSAVAFTSGSTYVAALQRQLPGPVSLAVFGDPTDAGAYAFRRVTNYYDDSNGFAFSLPSEGYLNFGMAGVWMSAIAVGLLLGASYRRTQQLYWKASHCLYPIVMSAIPYGLRSDALALVKLILYPSLALAVALRLSRINQTTRMP